MLDDRQNNPQYEISMPLTFGHYLGFVIDSKLQEPK